MDFVVVCLDSVCFIKDSQFFVTVLLTKLYLNGYFPFYVFFLQVLFSGVYCYHVLINFQVLLY